MRLPPLNALRAFEAAARHTSFARAANELHVTQGAISRHVKLLEEHLGVALFRRRPQGIVATEAGQQLLPELSAAFERIGHAAGRTADTGRELRVMASPSFATRWLVPHLLGYQSLYPDRRITLGLFLQRHDTFADSGFDVGVSWVEGRDAPRKESSGAFRLWQEALTPVCAPALLQHGAPLGHPADLARHTLLHPTEGRQDWRKWLKAAGLNGIDADGGQTFGTLDMAVGAAVGGMGVAIADLNLIRGELATGTLVAPFDIVIEDGSGYFVLTEPNRVDEPKIATFRAWLLAEAAKP